MNAPLESPTDAPPRRRRRPVVWGAFTVVTLGTALLVAAVCLHRGDGLERRLMRLGGRMVQAAAQQPRRTAVAFAALLGVSWTGLAIAAWMQPSNPGRDVDSRR